MLGLGTGEMVIVGLAIVLLFGGKKLPELAKGLGQGVNNFKKGLSEEDNEKTDDEKLG